MASFGLLTYLITLITLLTTVSVFGYRMLIVKEVSINPSIVNYNYIFDKIALVLIVYVFSMILGAYYLSFRPNLNIPFQYAVGFLASAIFFALSNLLFSFFHALNKFYLETIALFIFSLILCVGLYYTNQTYNMRWFALSYGIGGFVMSAFCIYFFTRLFNTKSEGSRFSLSKVKKEFLFVLPFAIISIGDIIFNSVDTLFVEAYLLKEDLGVYIGVLKVALGLSLISVVTYSASFPAISKILAKPSKEGLKKVLIIQAVLVLCGALVCLIYYTFNDFIVDVFLGKNFSNASSYDVKMFAKEISLFSFSKYCSVIPAIYLIASGMQMKRVYILISVLLVSTIAYWFLIPKIGLEAAIRILTTSNWFLFSFYSIICLKHYFKLSANLNE